MFGKNEIMRQRYNEPRLLVHSVFGTIQGEGMFSGHSAMFIRLGGCNLQCYFCDTEFSVGSEEMSTKNLLTRCENEADKIPNHNLVVITGGEPMLQNIVPLCSSLLEQNFHVQIETAGTVWPPNLELLFKRYPGKIHIVVSPKTSIVHEKVHEHAMIWKYIVKAGALAFDDGLPMFNTQIENKEKRLARPNPNKPTAIYVLPMDEQDAVLNKRNLEAATFSAMEYDYVLQVQLHKLIGVE